MIFLFALGIYLSVASIVMAMVALILGIKMLSLLAVIVLGCGLLMTDYALRRIQ